MQQIKPMTLGMKLKQPQTTIICWYISNNNYNASYHSGVPFFIHNAHLVTMKKCDTTVDPSKQLRTRLPNVDLEDPTLKLELLNTMITHKRKERKTNF
jgi:hypothetical protein